MKKITLFSYPLVVLNILLVSCTSLPPDFLPPETLKFNTQEFSPYHRCVGKIDSCTDAEVVGPVPEVVRVVCKEANINCRFALLDWQVAQEEVKNGKAQGLFIIGRPIELGREEWLHYQSDPIVISENGFFVKTGNRLLKKQPDPDQEIFPSDVKGFKIGVMERNTATYASLDSFLATVISEVTVMVGKDENPSWLNNEPLLKLLQDGKLDAVYINRDVGNSLIQALNFNNIVYAGRRTEGQQKYYVAISSEWLPKEMIKRFDDAYKKVHNNGTIQRILASYGLTLNKF